MHSEPRLVYVVDAERAELAEPLRAHFAGQPEVAVVVERRARREAGTQQRERHRAPVAERDAARAVPPEMRREATYVRLVQPMQSVARVHETTGIHELVRRSVAAEPAAVSELWWRIGERVRTRLRLKVGAYVVEGLTSQVLGRILDELPGYDPARAPLESWLDQVVDAYAIDFAASA